jgi:hypothetical protein
LLQSQNFGVNDFVINVTTFADNFAGFIDNNATDQRTRTDLSDAASREFQRSPRHFNVEF